MSDRKLIEEKKKELEELERKQEEERHRPLNEALARWKDVISTIPDEEKKNGKYELSIYPHREAESSRFSIVHRMDDVWNWKSYIKCDESAEPLKIRSNSVEKLLPKDQNDFTLLMNAGMQLVLKGEDYNIKSEWESLESSFRTFKEKIKNKEGIIASILDDVTHSYIINMRSLEQEAEEYKTTTDQEFKRDYEEWTERCKEMAENFKRSFYEFESNNKGKQILEKIKRIRNVLDS
jgi:hypothetical protein